MYDGKSQLIDQKSDQPRSFNSNTAMVYLRLEEGTLDGSVTIYMSRRIHREAPGESNWLPGTG